MAHITVAVGQLCSGSNKQANYEKAEAMIENAAKRGAQLIVFPENMNYLGPYSPDNRESVPDGEGCRRMAAAAKAHNIWVNLGSMKEISPDPVKSYNTSVLFDPRGQIAAIYRKLHLCDMMGRPGVWTKESDRNLPGSEIVVANTDLGKIGMSICYDIRFPELHRLLALQGVQIICQPACFQNVTGPAHWEVLLRAAAIHNSCYILAAGQCGKREDGKTNWGHSMIIDPWGTVIAEAGQEKEALLVADIDLSYADELSARLGSLHNRREDIYALEKK